MMKLRSVILVYTFTLVTLNAAVTEAKGRPSDDVTGVRSRRADDSNPLEAVVQALSQKVDQLTARNTALETQVAQNTAAQTVVAFTARFSKSDQTHLGQNQVLKFDQVITNQGNGYNPVTGFFTAPSAGFYGFYMNIAEHLGESTNICNEVSLVKNQARILQANACYHFLNSGSNMATLHLEAGDTVYVQMERGTQLHGDHCTFSGWKI